MPGITKEKRTPGDIVWAFAYEINHKQEPVLGMIVDDSRHIHPASEPKYFIPFNENGEPVWSNATDVSLHNYAGSRIEAIIEYNAAIDKIIENHRKRIAELQAEKISI